VSNRRVIIIPPDVAASVQFLSDRTCCVCRRVGKPVQIHHIDADPTNNDISNLAVLCLDCHMQTLVSGGFYRKLDANQVRLYRDDWLNIVTSRRNRKRSTRLALVEPLKPAQLYWDNRRGVVANQRVREKLPKLTLAEPLRVVGVDIIDDPDGIVKFRREWLPEGEGPPRKRGFFPILDVRLRNYSHEAILLNRLEVGVISARIAYDSATYHTPPVTWEYNVLLNPHKPGIGKVVKLAHPIAAGQTDRFIIIIGQLSGYGELKYTDYELHLSLFYDNEQSLDLGAHKMRVHSPPFLAIGKAGAIRYLKYKS